MTSLDQPSSPALALPFSRTERIHQGSLTGHQFFSLFLTIAGRFLYESNLRSFFLYRRKLRPSYLKCSRVQDCPRVGWRVNSVL